MISAEDTHTNRVVLPHFNLGRSWAFIGKNNKDFKIREE